MPVTCNALLFDLDGVLVDSRDGVELVWRTWAETRGLDADRIISVVHGRRASETVREVAPQADAAAEVAVLEAMEAAETRGIRSFAGAASLLASLPPTAWAIVTSGAPAVAHLRLGIAGLPTPAVLVTAADVAHGKPSPEGYLQAARRLGVRPADCVVVEDADAGIAAGSAAGMRVIAVAGTASADTLARADFRVGHVGQLEVEVASGALRLSFAGG